MFNFICTSWKKIKYKFRFFLPALVLFLFCNPVHVFAASQEVYIESSTLVTWYNSNPNIRLSDSSNTAVFEGPTTPNNLNEFLGGNPLVNDILHLRLYNNSHSINFQYIPEVYDYWVSFTAFSETTNKNEFTFVPDRFQIFERNCEDDGLYTYYTLSNFKVLHNDDSSDIGFTVIGKLPDNLTSNSPVGFRITDSSTGSLGYNLRLQAYLYAVPKSSGASSSDISAIISAIQQQTQSIISGLNSQTSTIGGKIDNTNNLINNGNSSTSGIVSAADSSKSELESIVASYQQIENNMLDNFTLYQSDILSDVSGWSWGGLSTCANWVGDTLTSYFQNMGDFKHYIIYPLLLGIALFFIGRGSSIIGHLYRKPTETYTFSERSSSTKYVNGQRITTSVTKSNRDGGVLRK